MAAEDQADDQPSDGAGDVTADAIAGPIPPESDPVATARRRHGTAGAVLAAGMFGVDIALGRKPKEEVPVVVDAAGEPTDIDQDGIHVQVAEDLTVWAPPPAPSEPVAPTRTPPRRRGR